MYTGKMDSQKRSCGDIQIIRMGTNKKKLTRKELYDLFILDNI